MNQISNKTKYDGKTSWRKVMKSFFDFLEEEGTELDERVDSLMTRIKRAKALRKNRAKMKMGRKSRRKIKIDKKTLMKRAKKAARSKLAKKRLKGQTIRFRFRSKDCTQ